MTRKGTDAGSTRPRDVDSHHELGVPVFGESTTNFIDRLIESDGGTLRQECRLDWYELVGLQGFADGNDIRFRHMTEILLEDPDPDPCMVLREEDYRVEARSLEGPSKKERGVKTGRETLIGYAT